MCKIYNQDCVQFEKNKQIYLVFHIDTNLYFILLSFVYENFIHVELNSNEKVK